jgi:hypothetical protein
MGCLPFSSLDKFQRERMLNKAVIIMTFVILHKDGCNALTIGRSHKIMIKYSNGSFAPCFGAINLFMWEFYPLQNETSDPTEFISSCLERRFPQKEIKAN